MTSSNTLDLETYLKEYEKLIVSSEVLEKIESTALLFSSRASRGGKLIIAGNGAGAGIASHLHTDFTKQAGVPALCFSDPALITAYANDYGYENGLARIISEFLNPEDTILIISVSGESPNLLSASHLAKKSGIPLVSVTGKRADNSIRVLSDVDFWIDSSAYNIVECIAMIWMCAVVDKIIGRSVYSVN